MNLHVAGPRAEMPPAKINHSGKIMHFLAEYGLFLAQAVTIVAAIVVAGGSLVALSLRQRKATEAQHLEVTHLNKQYEEMEQVLSRTLLSPRQFKENLKAQKKADKAKAKADSKAAKKAKKTDGEQPDERHEKRIFVLDFDGDIRATAVASLRQEISAILTMAGGGDEVVVRLESGGGVVHGYGLAASQLQRIREHKIPLTVTVDKVAASGGYMMACVADRIIAAPFAIIGSIGVLAQLPNLHRLLQKHEVDFEQLYAGEYKRTLTLFGENTDKAREKMQQELEETHGLFKDYVKAQRPRLDIDKVATGEHWLGTRALELGLVDRLQTSDDYLMAARRDAQLILLNYAGRKTFLDRFAELMGVQWPRRSGPAEGLDRPLLL